MAQARPVVTQGLRMLVRAMKQRYFALDRQAGGLGGPEGEMIRTGFKGGWAELEALESWVEQLEALDKEPAAASEPRAELSRCPECKGRGLRTPDGGPGPLTEFCFVCNGRGLL